jgi:hypothetical protein
MLGNIDQYADDVLRSVSDGSYAGKLSYSTFFVTNSNGKRRRIERPSLYTRVLQHLSIRLLEPSYRRLDPKIAYNCKEGYGKGIPAGCLWSAAPGASRIAYARSTWAEQPVLAVG